MNLCYKKAMIEYMTGGILNVDVFDTSDYRCCGSIIFR
jgi:hypothetical protein